jgi:putative transposase
MSEYRHGSHSVFSIQLHLVWVTKYRYPMLEGEVSQRVKALIMEICRNQEVEILKGHMSKEHIHLFVSIPRGRRSVGWCSG